MKGTTIYSGKKETGKGTGMEIKSVSAAKIEDNGATKKEGKVQMRFFSFGSAPKSLRFILTVFEAFALHCSIDALVRTGEKKNLTHKFMKDDVEIRTDLTIEKWVNGERSGYAFVLTRGADTVNVPVRESDLLFTSELLKALSVEQAWFSYKLADGTVVNEETIPAEDLLDTDQGTLNESNPTLSAENTSLESGSVSTNAQDNSNVSESVITGVIKSVRKDRKGFRIDDTWYKVDDNTAVDIDLDNGRGINVTVSYIPGNGKSENPSALRIAAA